MSRSRRARWRHASAVGLVGIALFAYLAGVGQLWVGLTLLVLAALTAWYVSPLRADGSLSHWDAQQRHVRDGSVVVYWRPGSFSCMQLRWSLGAAAKQILWVNVWDDDEAAAFVRDVSGGGEVVPTAILRNGDALGHPTPEDLKSDLAASR